MILDPVEAWDTAGYGVYRNLRLRPALDLLARVRVAGEIAGPVIDLGCGAGFAIGPLSAAFPGVPIIGVERDSAMLAEARAAHPEARFEQADISQWMPSTPPGLIFSNAVLQWLPDHPQLFRYLMHMLAPGGVLAVQMPHQFAAPSHALLRETAARLFPEKFHFTDYRAPVAMPSAYATILEEAASLDIWETEYLQLLPSSDDGSHPVRRFTESTAARPILACLDRTARTALLAAYDVALTKAYPAGPDGTIAFPFRRLFIVATAPR